MFRYVVLTWNEANGPARSRAMLLAQRLQDNSVGFDVIFTNSSTQVLCAGSSLANRVRYIGRNEGVVLGSVFGLPASDFADAPRLSPEFLIRRCWGNYVALLIDSDRHVSTLLRAPMGFLPCFVMTWEGVALAFSRMQDCVRLGIEFSINWDYVAAHAVYKSLRSSETAIREVSELKGGECVEFDQDRTTRRLEWHPAKIARTVIDDIDDAARRMRETAMDSVAALASPHQRVLLKLSGGFDSSVVLGCLAATTPRGNVTCVNDYSAGPNSDERRFARLAAQRARVHLVERERQPFIDLRAMLSARRTAILYPYFMELVNARPAVRLAHDVGASAIFSGTGGDEVFFRTPAISAAADFLRLRGPRPSLLTFAMKIARLERSSIWKVLQNAIAEVQFSGARSYWNFYEELIRDYPGKNVISQEVRRSVGTDSRFMHPWFDDMEGVPPGKVWQIFGLSFPSVDDPFGDANDADVVHPLLAQPLVETCLQIPTYLHLQNGWDRSIARQAFAHLLPSEIANRITKGGVEWYGKEAMMQNIEFMRAVLLEGTLVKERILDRHILEDALAARPTKTTVVIGDIMEYLSMEIWLGLWRADQRRAAA